MNRFEMKIELTDKKKNISKTFTTQNLGEKPVVKVSSEREAK